MRGKTDRRNEKKLKKGKAYASISWNWSKSIAFTAIVVLMLVLTFYLIGIAVGYLGYTPFTVYFYPGIAVVMMVVVYLISPWLIQWITHARDFTDSEMRNYNFVQISDELEGKFLRKPIYKIVHDDTPNAFCYGWGVPLLTRPRIAFTTGLLDTLNKEEITAVAAHEYGHYRNFDLLMTVGIAMMVMVLYELGKGMIYGVVHGKSDDDDGKGILVALVVGIFVVSLSFLGRFFQLGLSRSRETMADTSSALITGKPLALANALEKIDREARTTRTDDWESGKIMQSLFICNKSQAFSLGVSDELLSTHPATEKRIRHLKSLT
jgi:heat shock protein HtpX